MCNTSSQAISLHALVGEQLLPVSKGLTSGSTTTSKFQVSPWPDKHIIRPNVAREYIQCHIVHVLEQREQFYVYSDIIMLSL